MLELYLAATQAGLYITPINSHLAAPEIAYIVQRLRRQGGLRLGAHGRRLRAGARLDRLPPRRALRHVASTPASAPTRS